MKKIKSYCVDIIKSYWLIIVIVLFSSISIRYDGTLYDLGIGLLGNVITLLFIDSVIKRIEEKNKREQEEKEKYSIWVNNFNQDLQTTARYVSDIRNRIDMLLDINRPNDAFANESNRNILKEMLVIEIKLLASNSPIRDSFDKFNRIKISNAFCPSKQNLTADGVVSELNRLLKTLEENIGRYKDNRNELARINQELLMAQINFLKLKAKSFTEYKKDELA